jgi:hypothetical protein
MEVSRATSRAANVVAGTECVMGPVRQVHRPSLVCWRIKRNVKHKHRERTRKTPGSPGTDCNTDVMCQKGLHICLGVAERLNQCERKMTPPFCRRCVREFCSPVLWQSRPRQQSQDPGVCAFGLAGERTRIPKTVGRITGKPAWRCHHLIRTWLPVSTERVSPLAAWPLRQRPYITDCLTTSCPHAR